MITNQWYVGCAASQLPGSRPVGTRIGDRKIVLFRNSEGRAGALLDRCCHRGCPLSRGVVTEGRLQCGYHGWEYDATGRCVRIPSLNAGRSIPAHYGVPRFHCEEKAGYIWIWIGDSEPPQSPDVPEVNGDRRWIQGARVIGCNHLRALENLFDICHIVFVHPANPVSVNARQVGLAQATYELRPTANGCVMFTPPAASEDEPMPQTVFTAEFRLPGLIRIVRPFGGAPSYSFYNVTPLSEASCRLDWMVQDQRPATGEELFEWEGIGGSICDEDQGVLELVQGTYEQEGDSFERSVEADAPILALRRVLDTAEKGRAPNPSEGLRRRIISIVAHPRPQIQ